MENVPVFPRTYAEKVLLHAQRQKRRGRNPSESFLEERNPRTALAYATHAIFPHNNLIQERLLHLREFLPGQPELTYMFAEYLAKHTNSNLVPQGFVLAAQLALYDIRQGVDSNTGEKITGTVAGQLPIIYNILELSIPMIAAAIFPSDFANQTIQFVRAINQQIVDDRKKEKAAAPLPALPEDPLKIYTAARRIADISFNFYEIMGSSGDIRKPSCGDRRSEKVNPFYNQTTGGLFIEQYYGGPGSIWTPWGKWGCWGGGSGRGEDTMQAFLDAIGKIELAVPVRNTEMGAIGPIYAVLQVDDIVLPKPEERDRKSYIEYEDANRLWAEAEAMFQNQK